jgi:glyoxylase-like metal-dependent hydrolase (beta-lactamase superfamily II)
MDCCGHEGPGGGDARFEIQKVADGVYAAVAAPAYKVNCNTAIIENDDGVMIVDTHSKPSAARVIIARLRELTPKPVRYVVNTHREIHLLHLGRAHTAGDVFVYLPQEKVVITGDAVIGWTPFMGDGYPDEWRATLDRLGQLDFTHIIMGHGSVTRREWLGTFRSYVHDMVEAVRQEAATGATLDEVKQRVVAKLAPSYERPFSTYADYRPWRTGVAANIERTFAMVS